MFHLHEESVLHRDLAARNILLEPMTSAGMAQRWTPQITDFGLSKRVVPDEADETYASLPAEAADASNAAMAEAASRALKEAAQYNADDTGTLDLAATGNLPPPPPPAAGTVSSGSRPKHMTRENSTTFRGPYKYMAPESLRSLKSGHVIFSAKVRKGRCCCAIVCGF